MNSMRRHILLMEAFQIQKMLLENRVDFLKTKFVPILASAIKDNVLNFTNDITRNMGYETPASFLQDRKSPEIVADKLFNYVISCDPDVVKKNSQWLLTIIARKNSPVPLEDLFYVKDSLIKFDEMKKARMLPADKGDINRFKSISELETVLNGEHVAKVEAEVSEEQKMLQETTILLDDSHYRVLIPRTKLAAAYFGRNTGWCTAWGYEHGRFPTRTNHWETYKNSTLYIIEDKHTKELWQFSFDDNQYVDVNDIPIKLDGFLKTRPELEALFNKLAGDAIAFFDRYPVYASGRGFIVKNGPGLNAKNILAIQVSDTGEYADAIDNSNNLAPGLMNRGSVIEQFKDLMNDLKITRHGMSDPLFGIFFRDGVWGYMNEVGKTLYRYGDYTWKFIEADDFNYYSLMDDGTEVITTELNTASDKKILYVTEVDKLVNQAGSLIPEASNAMLQFLLQTDIDQWGKASAMDATWLTEADIVTLTKAKPNLTDVLAQYKVYGESENVKNSLTDLFNENDIACNGWHGNDMIIEKYATINDLVNDIGEESAQNTLNLVEEGGNFDSNYEMPENELFDFIKMLKPEQLAKLGQHLEATHGDIIEEEMEDFDPTSVDDIVELIDLTDDADAIRQHAEYAYSDGHEVGASNEAAETFHKAIETDNNIVFPTAEDGKMQYDTECYFVISLKEIINLIKNEYQGDIETFTDQFSYDNWKTMMEYKLEVEQPYYGWSGYDEEAAKERFLNEIDDLIN